MSMKDFNIQECMDCHCLAARRKAREITRLYDEHLRRYGVRGTQFSVLVALAISDGAPLGKLANALGMERTTLTRSIALLERKGWIRTDSSSDARVRPVRLTASGKTKLKAAYPGWKAAQKAAERKYS